MLSVGLLRDGGVRVQMQVMQELWSPRLDASHVMSPRVRFPIQAYISN